jgi:hypothetical protein
MLATVQPTRVSTLVSLEVEVRRRVLAGELEESDGVALLGDLANALNELFALPVDEEGRG